MSDDNPQNSSDPPSSNGSNGDDRDALGRFKPGWRGGPGSPVAAKARLIRERLDDALFKTCSPDRLLSAVDAILKLAEAGDVAACKLLFDRIAGPPQDRSLIERIEALELIAQEREA